MTGTVPAGDLLVVPARLVWAGRAPLVEWRRIERSRLAARFWSEAVADGRVERLTPLDALPDDGADLRLAGGIHHMWRCGSTLLCRQFGALPDTFALSEPFAFDALVDHPASDPALIGLRVRRLAAAFRDALAPVATRLVVKWGGGLTAHAAVLRDALPEVPAIFLHRAPVEVLRSMERDPIGLPGDDGTAAPAALLERIAGLIATACCRIADVSTVRRIDYATLPAATARLIAPWFGWTPTAVDIAAMDRAARADAKVPHRRFVADGAAKRTEASDRARHLADTVVAPALATALARLSPLDG